MKPQELLDNFITALETDDMTILDEVMCEDVKIVSSIFGIVQGLNDVKKKFQWTGRS